MHNKKLLFFGAITLFFAIGKGTFCYNVVKSTEVTHKIKHEIMENGNVVLTQHHIVKKTYYSKKNKPKEELGTQLIKNKPNLINKKINKKKKNLSSKKSNLKKKTYPKKKPEPLVIKNKKKTNEYQLPLSIKKYPQKIGENTNIKIYVLRKYMKDNPFRNGLGSSIKFSNKYKDGLFFSVKGKSELVEIEYGGSPYEIMPLNSDPTITNFFLTGPVKMLNKKISFEIGDAKTKKNQYGMIINLENYNPDTGSSLQNFLSKHAFDIHGTVHKLELIPYFQKKIDSNDIFLIKARFSRLSSDDLSYDIVYKKNNTLNCYDNFAPRSEKGELLGLKMQFNHRLDRKSTIGSSVSMQITNRKYTILALCSDKDAVDTVDQIALTPIIYKSIVLNNKNLLFTFSTRFLINNFRKSNSWNICNDSNTNLLSYNTQLEFDPCLKYTKNLTSKLKLILFADIKLRKPFCYNKNMDYSILPQDANPFIHNDHWYWQSKLSLGFDYNF